MIIPVEKLSADAVHGLIEEFITREGTDYGEVECALSDKVEQVKAQLASGEVVVVFDVVMESVSIKTRADADKAEREYQQLLDGEVPENAENSMVRQGNVKQNSAVQDDDFGFNQDVYPDD
ncbi:YheU family protein [Pseudomaricurvus sp.]|uniref:YheU family protein n=1 Tax=Pseudomaricurvus sp. TaxID=2004510 RepID=UPI003F6AA209